MPGLTPEEIVDAIIADIESRRGIGDEWDRLPALTQAEIRKAWIDTIKEGTRLLP